MARRSRKPSDIDSTKMAVWLPNIVLAWLNQRAIKNCVPIDEYLRHFIIQAYMTDQHGGFPSQIAVPSTPSTSLTPPPLSSTITVESNTAETQVSDSRSGFKGVYAYGKRWAAIHTKDGVKHRIGVADFPAAAAQLYAEYIEGLAETSSKTAESNENVVVFNDTRHVFKTKSGFKGVYAYGNQWIAVITREKKQHRLGTFATADAAAHAYDLACVANGRPPENFSTGPSKGSLLDDPIMAKIARGEQPTAEEFRTLARTTGQPVPRPIVDSNEPPMIMPFRDNHNDQIPADAPLTVTVPTKRLRRPALVEMPDSDEDFPDSFPEAVEPDPDPIDPTTINSEHVSFTITDDDKPAN